MPDSRPFEQRLPHAIAEYAVLARAKADADVDVDTAWSSVGSLGIDRPLVASAVDRLRHDGCLRADDGRLHITRAGERRLQELVPVVEQDARAAEHLDAGVATHDLHGRPRTDERPPADGALRSTDDPAGQRDLQTDATRRRRE